MHKEGSFYDLAIAIGILCSTEQVKIVADAIFFGELSLNGDIRATKGTFNAGLFALENGCSSFYISENSVKDVRLCQNLQVLGFSNLSHLVAHLKGDTRFSASIGPSVPPPKSAKSTYFPHLLDDIRGQEKIKKMAAVMIAGGHHMLIIGSPGIGKTLLASSLASILPPLSIGESIEVAKIYSYAGLDLAYTGESLAPPVRSPHHSTTYVGLIGGGAVPKPGEITLAHLGILFLDEFCEFPRAVIEVLRQPLEAGYIQLSRSRYSVKFPAKFTLLAAANPCKCGYRGDESHTCSCTAGEIRQYAGKLSGPILDRLDLITRMSRISSVFLDYTIESQYSAKYLFGQILQARSAQQKRYVSCGHMLNRDLTPGMLSEFAPLSSSCMRLLSKASASYNLSPRSSIKIIKIARTLADMDCSQDIDETHLLESVQYKCEGTI